MSGNSITIPTRFAIFDHRTQVEHYTPQQAGELQLTLDPGMAFGTGTHPTTQLMLSFWVRDPRW